MSNKLYTEEQVKQAWNTAFTDALSIDEEDYKPKLYNDFINSLTPIELPTDEEIERELESHEHMTLELEAGFRAGASYVIYKIQGGNNEQ